MNKEKLNLEFVFDNISKSNLWEHLSTSYGLATWFADHVSAKNDIYTFAWAGDTQKARKELIKPKESVRFYWEEPNKSNYFLEFLVKRLELTGTTSLQITDFCYQEDKEDSINLWNEQIKTLMRAMGV